MVSSDRAMSAIGTSRHFVAMRNLVAGVWTYDPAKLRPADLWVHGLAANAAYMKLKGALRSAFFIDEVPTNCRYFSIKVGAARKRIANGESVNSGIPHTLNVFHAWNS
jgi:hypothetical protein